MAKKHEEDLVPIDEVDVLEDNYLDKLQTDKRFSIDVDPCDRYHFSDTQKEFIANYVQFKNVPLAAKLTDIDEELAMSYYNSYNVKMEIRRINLALYHRAFATKMMSVDELGGYLTSVIIGENIAEADKIGTRDKMKAVQLIMELHKMKQESMTNPDKIIDAVDIQEDLSNLSVDAIQQLISSSKKVNTKDDKKEEIVNEIDEVNHGLSTEELSHLKSLPTQDLLKMLEETNKAVKESEENKKPKDLKLGKDSPSEITNKLKKYVDEAEEEDEDEEEEEEDEEN